MRKPVSPLGLYGFQRRKLFLPGRQEQLAFLCKAIYETLEAIGDWEFHMGTRRDTAAGDQKA